MNVLNVDVFLDGLARASIGTWISAFVGVAAVFAIGFALALRFTPKNEDLDDPDALPVKKRPKPPRGNGT